MIALMTSFSKYTLYTLRWKTKIGSINKVTWWISEIYFENIISNGECGHSMW